MKSLQAVVTALVLAGLPLTQAQSSGFDVIKNMCMRFWHQSRIKNNVLYIDGGQETFKDMVNGTVVGTNLVGANQTGPQIVGYNDYLIAIPLNETWDLVAGNLTELTINKTASDGNSTVPQLVRGSLFHGPSSDEDNLWLYGGTTSWWNTSNPTFLTGPSSDYYSLWSYSISDELWTQHSIQGDDIKYRPSSAAYAEAPDLGLAFYFNGEIDSGSSTETQYLGNSQNIYLEGMIVLNLTDQTARNISTAAVSGSKPRTRGVLEYIPGIGEKGILVAIGGVYKNASDYDSADEQSFFVDMSVVDIFDVASLYSSNASAPANAWYSQVVTGSIPGDRAQFCAVSVSAQDNSSHNIYIISGNNQAENTFYDDVYILSLPSFTWTQVFGEGGWPRYGHSCHRVGNRHAFTVGGAMGWGFDGGCDPETHGLAILDLSSVKWPTTYTPTDMEYALPGALIETIGGNETGGATQTAPSNGYTNLNLATLFGNVAAYNPNASNSPTPSSTSTPSPHHTNVGAIAGGVVGGVVGLALLLALAYFLLRHRSTRKRRAASSVADVNQPMMSQHPASTGYTSPMSPGELQAQQHQDAGPYPGYGVATGYGAHELADGNADKKDSQHTGLAEMDSRDRPVQLPGDERDAATELQGSDFDATRGRFELPGEGDRLVR